MKQFTIPEEESIDNAFAKFNTIITSLKALDEGFSSKICVRKFLRALHPKWRAKVTTIGKNHALTNYSLRTYWKLEVYEEYKERFRNGSKARKNKVDLLHKGEKGTQRPGNMLRNNLEPDEWIKRL
ncbi:hypothetical protein Tco_0862569 [Tanacetum coccineum]